MSHLVYMAYGPFWFLFIAYLVSFCFVFLLFSFFFFFFYDYLVNGILWTYLVFVYSMVGLWHMGPFSFYS